MGELITLIVKSLFIVIDDAKHLEIPKITTNTFLNLLFDNEFNLEVVKATMLKNEPRSSREELPRRWKKINYRSY